MKKPSPEKIENHWNNQWHNLAADAVLCWRWNLWTSILLAWMVVFAGQCLIAPCAALTNGPGEYQVKAAFLFNFVKFVDWPDQSFTDKNSFLIIGVTGGDPIRSALEKTFQGKTVKGRSIVIQEIKTKGQGKTCHVIFLTGLDKRQMDAWLETLKEKAVLTIGESDNFAAQGGMINFFLQDDRVRFEINPQAAEKAGLKISSQLLALAKIVAGLR